MTPRIGETWVIEHRFSRDLPRRVGQLTQIDGATKPGWLYVGHDGWLLADQWVPVRRIDLEEGVAA